MLYSAGGLEVSETETEWGPASLDISNFLWSTRILSQYIDTAEVRCASSKGIDKKDTAAPFMVAVCSGRVDGVWERDRVNVRDRELASLQVKKRLKNDKKVVGQ